jgi:hypothetical protein
MSMLPVRVVPLLSARLINMDMRLCVYADIVSMLAAARSNVNATSSSILVYVVCGRGAGATSN